MTENDWVDAEEAAAEELSFSSSREEAIDRAMCEAKARKEDALCGVDE